MAPKRYPWIAREGWPIVATIIAIVAALAAAFAWLSPVAGWATGVIGLAIVLWAFWFFRDPDRRVPADADAIICGADGVVSYIGPSDPPPELGVTPADARGLTRVSIFMNVFNVHVNRAPVAGVVERLAYRPGKFFNASLDKASEHNERMSLLLRLRDGRALVVVQVAGLIARRIVCRVKEGETLEAGERFGMIRFGSRVDHLLPAGVAPLVRLGQKTVAGETIIGRLAPVESALHSAETLIAQEV